MKSLWPAILASKSKAIVDHKPQPYLFQFYNILPMYSTQILSARSAVSRIFNNFVGGPNENSFLPKFIIILPDKDIIESSHHAGFGCRKVFEKTINWLLSKIDTELELRKEDLKGKRPGSLWMAEKYPQVVWVTMGIRPFIRQTDKGFVFAQYKTFNAVLENLVPRFKNTQLMELNLPDDRNLFDLTGNFTGFGKTAVWKEVNRFIRKLDETEASKLEKLEEWLKNEQKIRDQRRGQGDRGDRDRYQDRPHYNNSTYLRDCSVEKAYHLFNV